MDSDGSESDYEYESDGDVYMEMEIKDRLMTDNNRLLETLMKYSETHPLTKLGELIKHYDILDREVANRNWDLLVGSIVARAHWRKWARLWFGKRDKQGHRIVDRLNVERGIMAQARYEKEVSNPYRIVFLIGYLGKDIGNKAVEYL